MVSKVVTQVGVLEEGVQVVQPNSTSAATGVPIASQQVLGNDGSGNIAPVNLVAGTGMTITQNGQNITFVSTGGSTPSGGTAATTGVTIANVDDFLFSGVDQDIPITQTVATVNAAPTFLDTYGLFSGVQSLNFLSATSSKRFNFSIGIEVSVSLTSIPVQMFLYFYIAQGSSIPNGTAPFYMMPVTLSSPSQGVTISQYVIDNIPLDTLTLNPNTTYSIACAPFFYVPAGQTITGTGVSGFDLNSGSAYAIEQFDYADVTVSDQVIPLVRSEVAPSGLPSMGIYYSDTPFVYLPTAGLLSIVADNEELPSFPQQQNLVMNNNVSFSIGGFDAGTNQVYVGLTVNVGNVGFFTGYQNYVVTNLSGIIGTINALSDPREAFANNAVVSGIFYYTDNDAPAEVAEVVSNFSINGNLSYQSYVYNASYTGTAGMLNQDIDNKIIPADVALSPTPKSLSIGFPVVGRPNLPSPNSAANIIDVITIDLPQVPCDVDVTFNFSFQTNATTSSIASDTPAVYLVLSQVLSATSPTDVLTTLNSDFKQLIRSDTSLVNDHMTITARVSYYSSPIYISASAFICSLSGSPDVTATTFTAFGAGSTVAPLSRSSWSVNLQYAPQASSGGAAFYKH